MKKLILLFVLLFPLFSCHTKKNINVINYSTPLSSNENVEVIGIGQNVMDGAKLLGSASVGESGFTPTQKCTYSVVLNEIINIARSMGGNLIQITEHKEPDGHSTCHRIKADVYLIKK